MKWCKVVLLIAVAVILAVCVEMRKDTLTDWRTTLIAVLSIIAVFVLKDGDIAHIAEEKKGDELYFTSG